VDVKVDNESSSKIHVYHYEDGKYHYHKSLKAGETFEEHTETGENWAVSNPRTNRIAKAINVSKFNRTLRVTDRDLGITPRDDHHDDHHGDDETKVDFTNETQSDLDIYAMQGVRYKYQGTIRSGRSAVILLEEGQRWRAQSSATGAVIDDGIAPGRDVSVDIGSRRSHNDRDDHGDRDHGHDRDDHSNKGNGDVTVTVVNRSGVRVSVYKESPGGRRNYHGTLSDGRSTVLDTETGVVWIFFDSQTNSVIRTLEVPERDGTLTIFPENTNNQQDQFDDSDYDAPAPVRILRKLFGRE